MNENLNLLNISKMLNAKLLGDLNSNLYVVGISDLNFLRKDTIVCLKDKVFLKKILSSDVKAIVIEKILFVNEFIRDNKFFLVVDNIHRAFINLLRYFKPLKQKEIQESFNIRSFEGENQEGVYFESAKTVEIGNNTEIKGPVYIGSYVKIAKNVKIYPHVYIGSYVKIDEGSIIQSSCSIGIDGFSYYDDLKTKERYSIPHIGALYIGKRVELGSSVTIAKGTVEATIIDDDTKIDSQVHIGHNTIIGKRIYIAAQTVIGGSVHIGDDVHISGNVSIVDHVSIGAGSKIFGHSLMSKSIRENQKVWGIPARNLKEEKMKWVTINLMIKSYQNLRKELKIKRREIH